MATAVMVHDGVRHPTTADELLLMPEGTHGEIVEGVYVEMVPPSGAHGSVAARVAYAISGVVFGRALGEVFGAETAFRLTRNPETVRCPDAAFVVAARVPHGVPGGAFDGAPDLAVEVLSPSNTARDMQRKLAEYFRYGTQQVWLVDPETRSVSAYTAGTFPQFLEGDDVLDGGELLPGLSTPIAAFFAGLPADPPIA